MNKKELLELIVTRFRELPEIEGLIDETVEIRAKALSPEEDVYKRQDQLVSRMISVSGMGSSSRTGLTMLSSRMALE